jgi:hypothetical protein
MGWAASSWLAALLFLSLLLLYGIDHNYYATYFRLFFGWKGFGLLELALRGGREGVDTPIWRENADFGGPGPLMTMELSWMGHPASMMIACAYQRHFRYGRDYCFV